MNNLIFPNYQCACRACYTPMHEVTPSVVPMAVTTVMMIWSIIFQVLLAILLMVCACFLGCEKCELRKSYAAGINFAVRCCAGVDGGLSGPSSPGPSTPSTRPMALITAITTFNTTRQTGVAAVYMCAKCF